MEHVITTEMALAAGFTNAAYMDLSQVAFREEVRDMCAVNTCGRYGTSWACPPACGTLEEVKAKVQSYDYGILMQVMGNISSSFDLEAIYKIEKTCVDNLFTFLRKLLAEGYDVAPMSAGGCKLCEKCTYPDEPCRFPNMTAPSLEASGLVVSDECTRAGIPYYYGPNTMTFSVALLVRT